MVDLIRKPGVEISQVVRPTVPAPVTPTLAPCIVGPAFEVVEGLNDGLPNSNAVVEGVAYTQAPIVIPASEFPTNHADINEVSVVGLTDEISAHLVNGSSTIALNPSAPSAVVEHIPQATRPAIFFKAGNAAALDTWQLSGTGVPATNVDITVGDTPAAIVTKLNNAGIEAHLLDITVNTVGYAFYVTLPDVSASYGPNAFLQIISTGGVASLVDGGDDIRVDGSGLGAKIINNIDPSSFIGYSKGAFTRGNLLATPQPVIGENDLNDIDAKDVAHPAWLMRSFSGSPSADNAHIATFPESVDFTTLNILPATPRRMGDVMVVDGAELGMIMNVQTDRLELGSVDSARSTFNADGSPLLLRFTRDVKVSSVFSPTFAYIVGRHLPVIEPDSNVCAAINVPFTATTPLAGAVLTLTPQAVGGVYNLLGTELVIDVFIDEELAVSATIPFTENYDNIANVVSAINDADGVTDVLSAGVSGTDIEFTTLTEGALVSVAMNVGSTAAAQMTVKSSSEGTDAAVAGINGLDLEITLDDSAHVYTVSARSGHILTLISDINDAVGYPLATMGADGASVDFQSAMVGRLSHITLGGALLDALATAAVTTLSDSGTGRPNPNIHVTLAGTIHVAPHAVRSARTGRPKLPSEMPSAGMQVAVTYRGLRLDLSPEANNPGIIQISNVTELLDYLSPIDTRNPLALGVYYALLNAGAGQVINALGVSDVSSAEPEGTAISYMQAATFIEAHEVYSVVPLSHSEQVIEIFDGHVTSMSAPTGKRERVLISSPAVPTRKNAIVASSGEGASYAGIPNVVDTGDNGLIDALEGAGIDTSGALPALFDDGTELVLSVEISGEQRHYNVSSVAGPNVTVRTVGMPNDDGFYSSSVINATFSDATYSVFIRGAKLLVPGTNVLDRNAMATTVRDKAQQYANSRQLRLFPDSVQSVIGGVEQLIPMFYYGCAIAGATANLSAETPFSRRSMDGFTNVTSYDLTPNQLDIISAGNAVVEVEAPGLAPSIRIQCTTAPAALETREYSIVKAVDTFAKTLRSVLKGRVGLFNVTQTYMDETSTIVDVLCRNAVAQGLLKSATISKLEQSVDSPDTILVEVDVGVLYPANYIKITLLV